MGTIINARRETDQSYQYCKIYEATTTPSIGGWGVRDRANTSGGNTLCVRYPLAAGTILSTVSFIVASVGVGPAQNLYVGVWGQSPTYAPTRIFRVGTAVISVDDIGGDWTSRIDLTTTVNIEPIVALLPAGPIDMEYFLSFTCEDIFLQASDTSLGSSLLYGGIISNINDPSIAISYIDETDFSDDQEACSFEGWGRIERWTRVELGGTIDELCDEWQGAGTYSGSWTDVDNAFIDDANFAVADGRLYIDLGAGIEPAIPWNDVVEGGTTAYLEFPDYDDYGVRALCQLIIKGTIMDATDELTIEYCDVDTSSIPGPAAGWENLDTIVFDALTPFDNTYYLPNIVRWLKLSQTTTNAATDQVSYIEVREIGYGVSDGKFTVDHSQVLHRFWVDNYPIDDAVYKLQVANMAGAESETSTEFTNRINKD